MKCAVLRILLLVLLQKLAYPINLDGLRYRLPNKHISRSFSFKCELDETLVVGTYGDVKLPMHSFICGHHNPCGSSLRCTLTRSESCASPGEYISSIGQEIFGIASVCCKYDLTTANIDEHCKVMTIKGTSTIRTFSTPIHGQSPHLPNHPSPDIEDTSRPAKEKPGQAVTPPIPKSSAGSNVKTIKVPVEIYMAKVRPAPTKSNDRVVKSILRQSNGDWQVTTCSLRCRRATTYGPDPVSKERSSDDSETSHNTVADEAGGGQTDKSQNFDTSEESGISKESHGSSESDQKSKDPCKVNGDELQALLPNKKKHNKHDATEHTDLAEEDDLTNEHNDTSKPKIKAHSGGSQSISKSKSGSPKSKSKSNKNNSKSKSKSAMY